MTTIRHCQVWLSRMLIIGNVLLVTSSVLNAQDSCSSLQYLETPFNVDTIIKHVSHAVNNPDKIMKTDEFEPFPCECDRRPALRETQKYVHHFPARNTSDVHALLSNSSFLIDTSIVYTPAWYSQTDQSVAFDGTNYLVVWVDDRGHSDDIYGARVTPQGIVLDPAGFLISGAQRSQRYPSVAFDGTNYLVAWVDARYDIWGDIYCTFVTPDGIVLESEGICISSAPCTQYEQSIAFDGTNYLVVWMDARTWQDYDIYGARVNPKGDVLDTAGFTISTAWSNESYPSIVFNGVNYLVVWDDGRNYNQSDIDIYGARVSSDGVVIDTAGIAISTARFHQYNPVVAFDGTNHMVAWGDNRADGSLDNYDIYGARVTLDGVVLDTAGIAISTAAYMQFWASIAFDGTNYLVVWDDSCSGPLHYDISGARVSKEGIVLDSGGFKISTAEDDQVVPSIAFDGSNYLVVWTDERNYHAFNGYDIYGTYVNEDGVVLDTAGINISTALHYELLSSVAFDGTNYLVVWEDYRNGLCADIYGARVSGKGVILDPEGFPIATAAECQTDVSVAFDGTNYLVVWLGPDVNQDIQVWCARVSQEAVILDPGGFIISDSYQYKGTPSVAFDGTNYLVVWAQKGFSFSDEIRGAFVTQGGFGSRTFVISSIPEHRQMFPSVAFDGTNYLVVWEDYYGAYSDTCDIYGARVSPSGIVLDPTRITISTAQEKQEIPLIAFDGENYLVVWDDERNDIYTSDIYGTRISKDGEVLDPDGIPISTAVGYEFVQSIVFDGAYYLVAWDDYRNGNADIYGAKVSPKGDIIETIALVAQPGYQIYPAIINGSEGELFLTYTGWCSYINNHPANTYRIWGTFYGATAIHEDKELISAETGYGLKIFPNPFSNTTEIRCELQDNSPAELMIYDAAGRLVRVFSYSHSGTLQPTHIAWDGRDDHGEKLPAGIYFGCLRAGDVTVTAKIAKLR